MVRLRQNTSSEHEIDADTFRTMFGRHQGVCTPLVRLNDIPDWASLVEDMGLSKLALNRHQAHVCEGYFYLPHTPLPVTPLAPTLPTGSTFALYPAVRRIEMLHHPAAAHIALPFSIEAQYRIRGGVDIDLRAQLGVRGSAALHELSGRALQLFSLEVVRSPDPTDWAAAVDAFMWLIGKARQHGTVRYPTFTHATLETLVASATGGRLCFFLRRSCSTGLPVQAILGLLSRDETYFSVLAIVGDRGQVSDEFGLTAASMYDIYHWGAAHGVRVFGLGNTNAPSFMRIGANEFFTLDHLLFPGKRIAPAREAVVLRDACVRRMESHRAALVGVVRAAAASRAVIRLDAQPIRRRPHR